MQRGGVPRPLAARLGGTRAGCCAAFACAAPELSVVLVFRREMRALNRRWRRRDRPTDVLSFAQREGRVARPTAPRRRRDLGPMPPGARPGAGEARTRADRLLIHGLLHLLGYDHRALAAEARRDAAGRERRLARWL